MSTIQIFLVEDDPDWIKAMTVFLNGQEDMLVAGAAQTPEQAAAMARVLSFDVVLMDIQLTPGQLDGIYTAADILEIRPQAKVIMLTSMDDEQTITQAFTAGAVQYIEKARFKELPGAIRGALLHAGPMEALLKEFSRLKREEQLRGFKSESTLKNQINKILKKLGVKSGKEAVEKVRRKGIIKDR